MSFPTRRDDDALHRRVLAADPVASADVFAAFTELITRALQKDLHVAAESARDAAIDAVFAYLQNPAGYQPELGRLGTFLSKVAKNRLIDVLRARTAEARREEKFGVVVELRSAAPKEEMERALEARRLWDKVEHSIQDARDRAALTLILDGERSTEALARALGVDSMPPMEQRREVKRHRDRLLKVLARLGEKLNEKST